MSTMCKGCAKKDIQSKATSYIAIGRQAWELCQEHADRFASFLAEALGEVELAEVFPIRRNVVVTGEIPNYDPKTARIALENAGYTISGHVDKNTAFVVVGWRPAPHKIEEANEFGAKWLDATVPGAFRDCVTSGDWSSGLQNPPVEVREEEPEPDQEDQEEEFTPLQVDVEEEPEPEVEEEGQAEEEPVEETPAVVEESAVRRMQRIAYESAMAHKDSVLNPKRVRMVEHLETGTVMPYEELVKAVHSEEQQEPQGETYEEFVARKQAETDAEFAALPPEEQEERKRVRAYFEEEDRKYLAGREASRKREAREAHQEHMEAVRSWGRRNGFKVGARGRIPMKVQMAYNAAHAA